MNLQKAVVLAITCYCHRTKICRRYIFLKDVTRTLVIPSKQSELPGNPSNEISDTYEEYADNNSYADYKLSHSYEVYIEKYQKYDHFLKFQQVKCLVNPVIHHCKVHDY